jgi:dephospho-CoA kinase
MPKIVGLAGTIGAGKEIVKEFLMKRFNCYYVSISSFIGIELEKRKSNLNRKNLQDQGNELRKKYGNEILAKLAISYMPRDKELIIVDGIRNPGEIDYLRKQFGNNFVLIAVDAPQQIRFERMQKRNRPTDPKTWEEFVAIDERDQGVGEPEYGQQTKKCLEAADFVLVNDGSAEQVENKLNEIIQKIMV